jgi:flagella basal body P-ring formation protein FlgA
MDIRPATALRLLPLVALWAASAFAAEREDAGRIVETARSFLTAQAAAFGGDATIEVGRPDPRLRLARCEHLEAFLPPGSRPLGRTGVGVRCSAPAAWTVYLSAQVRVLGDYVATATALVPDQVIAAADLVTKRADLGTLPADTLTRAADGVGMRVRSGVAPGTPLRRSILRPPRAVQQGQTVSLVIDGGGFVVRAEGRALANADVGDSVAVRTASGSTVSGIARAGQWVEIPF